MSTLNKIFAGPQKLVKEFQKLPQMQQLAIVAVIGLGLWWLYKKYGKREMFEQPQASGGGELVCTMYYTTWCPHCTSAKPEWEKLQQTMNGKFVGGTKIVIASVDCEKEKDKAAAAGVTGFPTFKFDMNGKSLTFSGKERTFDAFREYINSIVVSQ